MSTSLRLRPEQAAKRGVLAGLVGGVALAILMLIVNNAKQQDLWSGMKMAGIVLLGDQATQPGFAWLPVLVGATGHLLVSAIWGLLFGMICYYFRHHGRALLIVGAFWGLVVWFVMFHGLAPILGLREVVARVPSSVAVFELTLFGLVVAAYLLSSQHDSSSATTPNRTRLAAATGSTAMPKMIRALGASPTFGHSS